MADTKPKSKVSLCFLVPLESAADQKEIQAAYKTLHNQVTEFANAIIRDKNALIAHTVVSEDPKDMKPIVGNIANATMATTQSMRNQPNPAKALVERIEADQDEEPPRVQAGGWTPPSSPAPTKVAVKTAPAASNDNDVNFRIEEVIFSNLKRTKKSQAILKYLIAHKDTDVEVSEICKGTGLDSPAVGSWIQQTSGAIKAFTNVKRGVYRFESAKVKI